MALADFFGKKVGFVRIEEPHKYHRSYEVACWYQDILSDIGDFDLIVGKNDRGCFTVYAKITGTVCDNYNAPLFGGVAVGASRSERGQRSDFSVALPIEVVAAEQSHHIKNVRFILDRDRLDDVIEYAEGKLKEYCEKFPGYYSAYLRTSRSQFNSEIGMVAHISGEVQKWGRTLEGILRHKDYRFGNFAQYEKTQSTDAPVPAELTPA